MPTRSRLYKKLPVSERVTAHGTDDSGGENRPDGYLSKIMRKHARPKAERGRRFRRLVRRDHTRRIQPIAEVFLIITPADSISFRLMSPMAMLYWLTEPSFPHRFPWLPHSIRNWCATLTALLPRSRAPQARIRLMHPAWISCRMHDGDALARRSANAQHWLR